MSPSVGNAANVDPRPVIIKRRRGTHFESYGGAWKIALADFMQSMMALFLVLWVISMATPKQLQAMGRYFRRPLIQAISSGDKTNADRSVIPGGGPDHIDTQGQVQRSILMPSIEQQDAVTQHLEHLGHAAQKRQLGDLSRRLSEVLAADKDLDGITSQMRFQMVPQGLRISIMDSNQRSMFDLGSATPEPYMVKILHDMVPVLNKLPNDIAIYGYTDSRVYPGNGAGYTNWELSTERANASRRALVAGGLNRGKLISVAGFGDRMPLPGISAKDPRNRRIELLVLTPRAERQIEQNAAWSGGSAANQPKSSLR